MLLKSRSTGEKKWLPLLSAEDRTLWLYRKKIRAFDRMNEAEGRAVTFLTVTQSDRNIGDGKKWISDLMRLMTKDVERKKIVVIDDGGAVMWERVLKMDYVAVLEIQPKRYRTYGVLAPHWHIAISVNSERCFPHSSRDERMGRTIKVRDGEVITYDWLYKHVKQRFGIYFVCDCYSRDVSDYLGKYLAKGEYLADYKVKTGKRAHVFSSSQFPIQYRMSWIQQRDYAMMKSDVPEIEQLYLRSEGSRIVARARTVKEVFDELGRSRSGVKYDRVFSIPGEWVLDDD